MPALRNTCSPASRGWTALIGVVLAMGGSACTDTLDPGVWGTPRYVGNFRGSPPMKFIPPIADRVGLDEYVVWGALDELNMRAFDAKRVGLWLTSQLCYDVTPSQKPGTQYGVHGWVGYGDTQAIFWAGTGIYNIFVPSPGIGSCSPYLDQDFNTKTALRYVAIIPWIKDTPSRTTFVALIKSDTDKLPFQVIIDLRLSLYRDTLPFDPPDADELTVLGVGAHKEDATGVVLLRYKRANAVHVEARFLDMDANTTAIAHLSDGTDMPEYGVQGFLQSNESGLYAGLDDKGNLITLNQSGGRIRSVSGMTPVGVHRFQGNLWLVGTGGGGPVVAPINDDASLGAVVPWTASRTAAAGLTNSIVVRDDRRLPPHSVNWKARNALGPYPFVSPQSPFEYADGETLWLIAGPSYTVQGDAFTAVALAPVGISYP